LLEQTPIAVVNVGKDNKISFVNPAFHELFGYSHEESLGQNLDYLLAPPGALDEMGEYSKNRMGERLYITGIRKKKDGSMTDVEVVAHPFFVGSINYGHLVFYIDISERLKAEAELESTTTAIRLFSKLFRTHILKNTRRGIMDIKINYIEGIGLFEQWW
jgi:PAS domain S-box-containing protein